MITKKISNGLGSIANPLSRGLNRIAGFFLAIMMLLTGVDVALRYFFNAPIPGSYEITEFIMPLVVAFGLAHCAFENGHVQVDLFTSMLPHRIQHLMKTIAYLLMSLMFGLITWQSIVRAKELFATQQHSEVLYLPIFPFVIVTSLGCAVFSLAALTIFFKYLSASVDK